MFGSIFRFELRYHLRSPLFWGMSLLFGLLTFAAVTTDVVRVGGAIGNIHRNSSFVILQFLTSMSFLAMLVVTAFVASSALRDFDHKTHELFFSRPVRKRDYLLGRFLGSLTVSFGVMVFCALGMLLGSFMPWLEAEQVGPFSAGPYLFGLLVISLPNLFLTAALFFALAIVTRSWLSTYLGVVVFFAGYGVASVMMGNVERHGPASLLDPFGATTLDIITRYWTVAEKNGALPELAGWLLGNRLLWLGFGLVALAVGYRLFRPEARPERRAKKGATVELSPASTQAGTLRLPAALRRFDLAARWAQFLAVVRLETRTVIKGVPFLVILAFGLANMLISLGVRDQFFGTAVYPVTRLVLEVMEGTFTFLLVIVVTFYAGEILGRERAAGTAEVHGALPVPDWVPLLGKLSALLTVVLAFLASGAVVGMLFQLATGYTRLEPVLYLQGALLQAWPFALLALMALVLQALAPNKFVGYAAMILVLVSGIVYRSLDWDHHLYRYAAAPSRDYSDMNGFGHFVVGQSWFLAYWTAWAVLLLGLAMLFWVRGSESDWRARWKIARQRWRGPARRWVAVGGVAAAGLGGWIFYNTNVLNEYVPEDLAIARQASYEKKYRQYRDIAMPRIVDVETEVDLFPDEGRVRLRGRYVLANKTAQPISELHLTQEARVDVHKLTFPGAERTLHDAELGYSIYRLTPPLAPGATGNLEFDVEVRRRGFENDITNTSIVDNGTFFNNYQYLPTLGYVDMFELQDRNDRRKHDLPPIQRMAKLEDEAARRNTYLTADSDWIGFRTTVSTVADQVALAPGYLVKEWREGDRRFFRYEMDSPILHFYSYLSARWEVARDRWNDVAIEVYHHPDHAYNVGRMIDSVKKSLDYFTSQFGPYQHRQVRILEFPRYQDFAQAFPNTIPYSEGIGFIADLSDPEAIDYVFYITAHEVAHQWWAHQVIGANVQGATMLSESLAQYSALMVMEKEYGREKMRRFLKFELDRYLQGRGGELVEEQPLMRVENQQYIHYNKGSLSFYALRDAIGEEALNRALARFVAAKKFQQPPYTISTELLAEIRQETPPERLALLSDLFETITLWDHRLEQASWKPLPDGKYEVTLVASARKLRADGEGHETEVELGDPVEVGVFGSRMVDGRKEETVLYLARHALTQGENRLTVVVDAEPVEAGVDPYNKLIDRVSGDNRKAVGKE